MKKRLTADEKRERFAQKLMTLTGMGRDVFMGITASHPIVVCVLGLMGITGVKILIGKETPETQHIHGHLNGLYGACQTIAAASAAVPVVAGALNLVGGYLATRGART